MSRLSLIIAAIVLSLTAACAPSSRPDPNPQPDHGPPGDFMPSQPVDPALIDYHVLLHTDNDTEGAHYFDDRWADCTVIGYNKDRRVVTVKDSKTGLKMPFQMLFEDLRIPYNSGHDLPIANLDKAASTIEVVCTTLLYPGDAVYMDVTNKTKTASAALLGGIDTFEVPRGGDPERLQVAMTTATIAAL